MKKTNFTFSGTSMKWLLKSIVPVLFFMTLSLGAEAQVETPGSVLSQQKGITLTNPQQIGQRLEQHITTLQAQNPSTPQEEVEHGVRLDYALYIANVPNGSDITYHVLNSMSYLEARIGAHAPQFRPNAVTIYDEMVTLLQ